MAELMTGKRWHTREDSGLRLDRELRWWHDDERIEHPRIVELFNSSLGLDDSGRFVLRIGNDWARVSVEDAAYEVRTVDVSPEDRLSVRLSDRTAELLDPATLSMDPDGVITCQVKERRAKARFSRDAQFQLGALLAPSDGGVVLEVGARREPLPDSLGALFDPA
jgi:hypothetical protein